MLELVAYGKVNIFALIPEELVLTDSDRELLYNEKLFIKLNTIKYANQKYYKLYAARYAYKLKPLLEQLNIREANEEESKYIYDALSRADLANIDIGAGIVINSVNSFIERLQIRGMHLYGINYHLMKNELQGNKIINEKYNKKSLKSYYRGITNCIWDLKPSVLRNYDGREIDEYKIYTEYQRLMFRNLKNQTLLETMTNMQHYGLPTRLLDVTSNPLVALFMACWNKDRNNFLPGEIIRFYTIDDDIQPISGIDIVIHSALPLLTFEEKKLLFEFITEAKVLNFKDIEKCNISNEDRVKLLDIIDKLVKIVRKELYIDISDINLENLLKSYIVAGGMVNDRIKAQNGSFILTGLDAEYNDQKMLTSRRMAPRFFVFNQMKILNELEDIDIHEFSMFPDMEHCANYLKNICYLLKE